MAENSIMVITGTSQGIGRGMAEHFLSKGYTVVGCSRGETDLATENYYHFQVDIGSEGQVRQWVRRIKKEFKQVDVLVCNAGIVSSALLMSVTSGDILERFIHTNFAGTYFVCREISKLMISKKKGRIITLSSLGVPLHLTGTSAYSATKSAIIEMTKILAKELAPVGITCNVLGPALHMTEPAKAMGEKWREDLLSRQTIKRTVSIKEICNVISFFASPESGCITGQVINMGLVS